MRLAVSIFYLLASMQLLIPKCTTVVPYASVLAALSALGIRLLIFKAYRLHTDTVVLWLGIATAQMVSTRQDGMHNHNCVEASTTVSWKGSAISCYRCQRYVGKHQSALLRHNYSVVKLRSIVTV